MQSGLETGPPPPEEAPASFGRRLRRLIVGRPRDLADRSIFHRLSLIPLLAWVGLGADGLSSSAYGPEEAFLALGGRSHLALLLAVFCVLTVSVISASYSYIIEEFPAGGGGYAVASKLLGPFAGLVSGCSLLIDYVLTITVSISAAGDAIFSLFPGAGGFWKFLLEVWLLLVLSGLNLRGVRESILTLVPVFALFVLTHVVLVSVGLVVGLHDWWVHGIPEPAVAATTAGGGLGFAGTLLLLAKAYSLGGGTYTGIEAVSNGMPMMREPRVRTGRRTMLYMAISLSITAGGLLVCYYLWNVQHAPGKTLNAVLAGEVGKRIRLESIFPLLTLGAESLLLVVAAQTGFLGGPHILANMARDSWVPRRFAGLSERLTTQNGIVLVGGAALAALFYTRGNVDQLVVMYSVNVFLTFSLSMLAMLLVWTRRRRARKGRKLRLWLFGVSFALCATILAVTVYQKFMHGAWLTIAVTGCAILLCLRIRRHYRFVGNRLRSLDDVLTQTPPNPKTPPPLEPEAPTAAVLVGGYSGVGVHTLLAVLRAFPGHFKNFIFVSVGVVDSGVFKGVDELDALRKQTAEDVEKYVKFARANGLAAAARFDIGTEVAASAEEICREILKEFPRTIFFGGKVVFEREGWTHRLLHNETGYAVERHLHALGQTMVVLPVRVR